MRTFNSIIVGPDVRLNQQLKTAAQALPKFRQVAICATANRALDMLDIKMSRCDLIFIADEITEPDPIEFVQLAKKRKGGDMAAFILVGNGSDGAVLAERLLGGFDGFILEPFSADALQAMAELADTVRTRKEAERKRAAIVLLGRKLVVQFSRLAYAKRSGRGIERCVEELQQTRKKLESAVKETPDVYHKVMIDLFEQVPPPARSRYNGPSERVKKLEEQRCRERREQLLGGDEENDPKVDPNPGSEGNHAAG